MTTPDRYTNTMKKNSLTAELLLVGITLIWGGTFVFIKEAVQVVPPFTLNALRFGLAFVVSIAVFSGRMRLLSRRELMHGLWLGVLYGVGFFLQTVGLQYTSVGRSSFITGSLVVMVPIAYRLVERRHTTTAQKIGVLVVAAGLWVFTNPAAGAPNLGDVLTFIGAAGWALYICYLDVFTRTPAPDGAFGLTVRLVVLQFATACAIGVGGMLAVETPVVPSGTDIIIAVLYTSLLASVVATFVQTHFQHRTTPVRAALIFALEPVFASVIAAIAVGEKFGPWELTGGSLVLIGVLVGETGDLFLRSIRRADNEHT